MIPTFDLLPLLIPTAVAMLALPFGLRARAAESSVRAVYLFHRSGDPLATVASADSPAFEPTQLGPVLGAVRAFVENADPRNGAVQQTTRRFGEEGLVAVRGQYLSACAVFRVSADGSLRRELVRFVREFEARNEANLDTWEHAAEVADEASSAISGIAGGIISSAA